MSKVLFQKIGGWAFVLSGLALFLVWGYAVFESRIADYDVVSAFFYEFIMPAYFIVIPSLLMIGMLGLRSRYGTALGSFGKRVLRIGIIGTPLLSWAPWIANIFYPGAAYLSFLGPGIGYFCLGLFGIVMLRRKLLPQMNWLPFAAGLPVPLWMIGYLIDIIIISARRSSGSGTATAYSNSAPTSGLDFYTMLFILVYTFILVQILAMVILGFVLNDDLPKQKDAHNLLT